jgi:hypothetical protein
MTPTLSLHSWYSRRLGHWVAVCVQYPDLNGAGKTRMAARLDLENQIASLHG